MAYKLELPFCLIFIHLIFHVSMLRKCMGDPSQIVPIKDIGILDSLSY